MLSGRDCNGSCTVRDMPDREEEACQKKIRLMKSDNSVKRGRGLVGVVAHLDLKKVSNQGD